MAQQQIALLSLTQVRYIGGNVGSNFAITIDSIGENTVIQTPITAGQTKGFSEPLIGQPAAPVPPTSFPISAHVQCTDPGSSASGYASTTLYVQTSPTTQLFTVNVAVSGPTGSATFELRITSVWREYPVSYDPEWLCRVRHDWSAFHRWLCLGEQQYPSFYSLTPVISITQHMQTYMPRLEKINTMLGLGYVSAGPTFFEQVEYTFDVTLNAVPAINARNWRWQYIISDFADGIEQYMGQYIGSVIPGITQQRWDLCNKWRELLDCFCAFCAKRSELTLSTTITDYFDYTIKPIVNATYSTFLSVSQQYSLDFYFDPFLTDQCDKLRRLVSFWAWWCRICNYALPVWEATVDPYYADLFYAREELKGLLEMESITLCDPPQEDFCDRWGDIWDCLEKLCLQRGTYDPSVVTDMESTFGPIVRQIYQLVRYPLTFALPGIENTCTYISWLKKYFETICPDRVVPGGSSRRMQLDSLLLQFETALTGFRSRNGDLCSPMVMMEGCEEWGDLLGCLSRVCANQGSFTANVINDFYEALHTDIDNLYWLLKSRTYGPASFVVMTLCDRIDEIRTIILEDLCPDTMVHEALLAKLNQLRASIASSLADLNLLYPGFCADTFCDDLLSIFHCFRRLCDRRDSTDPDVIDAISTLIAASSTFNGMYTQVFGQPPQPPSQEPVEAVCHVIGELREWVIEKCACSDAAINETLRDYIEDHYLSDLRDLLDAMMQCQCRHMRMRLDLTTGAVPWIVTETVTGVSVPAPANIVTGTSGIDDPIPGTEWISPLPTAASSQIGWTEFQRDFCLCDDSVSVRIVMEFRADDTAQIYLDGTLLMAATQQNMTQPEFLDTTRTLSSGRHIVRVRVLNSPAGNMALAASGYLQANSALLMEGEQCRQENFVADPDNPVRAICCLDFECDKVTKLPRYYRLLCANAPNLGDTHIAALEQKMTWLESRLVPIVEALGLDPEEMPSPGSSFCVRLEYLLQVLIHAYSNPSALTIMQYYTVECFYRELSYRGMYVAFAGIDDPGACATCAPFCEGWLDLLNCLCRLCADREKLVTAGIADDFDTLLCPHINALDGYIAIITAPPGGPIAIPVPPPVCCQPLHNVITFMALSCIRCEEIDPGVASNLALKYDTISAAMAEFTPLLTGANLSICDDLCRRWLDMLECLVRLCLNRADVPETFRIQFDALFTARIAALYQRIFSATGPASPFSPEVFGTSCWNLLEVVQAFYWICSPFHEWDPELRADLETMLVDWEGAYIPYRQNLAGAGVHACDAGYGVCDLLANLPEHYALFCVGEPNVMLGPVAAVEDLLLEIGPDMIPIQNLLRLTPTPMPTGTFCERLRFVLGVMAVAYSRMYELSPQYKIRVEFFARLFEAQAEAYRALPGIELPSSTAMGRFRAKWMELLACICAVCETDLPLPQGILNSFETNVGPQIQGLYDLMLTYAPYVGQPVIADPCPDAAATSMNNRCRQLRIVMSFFAIFGLGYDEAPNTTYTGAMNELDALIPTLGSVVASLRGLLATNQIPICGEERYQGMAIQSPYLYLQAAGSDQSDGTAGGVHLRWQFLDRLQNHLPKGNLAAPGGAYAADYGFNKPDDFVRIFRTPYKQAYPITIDLYNKVPHEEVITGMGAELRYTDLQPDGAFPVYRSALIRFKDVDEYQTLLQGRQATSSATIVMDVISQYTGIMEVEVIPSSLALFALEIGVTSVGSPNMKIEGISYGRRGRNIVPIVSCREEFTTWSSFYKVYSEMVQRFRFQYQGCYPVKLKLETYEDFYLAARRRFAWEKIGEFALSLDQTEVFNRLEDVSHYPIDNLWPRYVSPAEASAVDPGGKVKVANYREKWNPLLGPHGRQEASGIRHFVEQYLTLSTDPDNWDARELHGSLDPDPQESSKVEISLLRMLNFASVDFHIARMLGLGYIDWQVPLGADTQSQKYVYFAEYDAEEKSGGATTELTHRFLSLPTSRQDYRLPVAPELGSHDLGLPRFDETVEPFTDENGYTKYGDSRFIRFNRKTTVFDLEQRFAESDEGFFFETGTYSRGRGTMPVLYGIRYREVTGGVPGKWVLPDIANDAGSYAPAGFLPFEDHQGNAEAIPIPDRIDPATGAHQDPLFIHELEKERDDQKIYNYGIYGVNWFSRVSPTTPYLDIENDFPKRNTLVPPLNLTAQFIQREMPRIFNSEYEQEHENLHELTRVTFDWTHVHNREYDRATSVGFLFREMPPDVVRGEISEVVDVGDGLLDVFTTSYVDYSGPDGVETIEPTMNADPARFVGSLLVAKSLRYYVTAVRTQGAGGYAVFTVKQEYAQPVEGDVPQLRPDISRAGEWYGPLAGEQFAVVENLGDPDSWTALPDARVEVITFTDNGQEYHETETDRDGRTQQLRIGGITRQVTATEEFGVYPEGHEMEGQSYPTGSYKLVFDNFTLPPYAGSVGSAVRRVEWYMGVARVNGAGGEKKVLKAVKILTDPGDPSIPATPLTVWVYDPSFADTSDLIIPRNGQAATIEVNFHPSYRVYFDLSEGNAVDIADEVLPAVGEKIRQTFIGGFSVDGTNGYESAITSPAVHIARRILEPKVPNRPQGAQYATRPDYYGKSSFTFDTMVDMTGRSADEPYGMIFFRASDEDVLRALYTPATIQAIRQNVPLADDDEDFFDRWGNLVDAIADANNASLFPEYSGTGETPYRMPVPDNEEYTDLDDDGEEIQPFDGSLSIGDMAVYIRRAIMRSALPLTRTPVLMTFVPPDNALVTSSRTPVWTDAAGEPTQDPAKGFDPFPMVSRREVNGDWKIRFSDFTLDGAARNFYFYFSAELSDTGMVSNPGEMLGPVRLINSFPAAAPAVRGVKAQAANPLLDMEPAVVVSVNSYLPSENIRRVALFRARTPEDALSLRTMTEAVVLDLPEPAGQGIEYVMEDTFADLTEPPYGEVLYYRAVVYRRIINEAGAVEYAPSQPSRVLMANIIDSRNPEAPELHYEPLVISGGEIQNLTLTWAPPPTGQRYYLYRQTSGGNWVKLKEYGPDDPGTYVWATENPENPTLPAETEDGDTIYYRFRMDVKNASGLMNLEHRVLLVPTP